MMNMLDEVSCKKRKRLFVSHKENEGKREKKKVIYRELVGWLLLSYYCRHH
jgi:hypothetical protein